MDAGTESKVIDILLDNSSESSRDNTPSSGFLAERMGT